MKLQAMLWQPASQTFQPKEMPGPATFADWERCWRLYSFGMRALEAASPARLQRYRDKIADLVDTYSHVEGGGWWLVAMAGIRMRSEHLERIRRRCVHEHAELTGVGLQSDFVTTRPWDKVFKEAARDVEYWSREVDRAALMYAAHVKDATAITGDGTGFLREGPQVPGGDSGEPDFKKQRRGRGLRGAGAAGAGKGKPQGGGGKGGAQGQGAKQQQQAGGGGAGAGPGAKAAGKALGAKCAQTGKFLRDDAGTQVCWTWNRGAGACAAKCPNGRLHVCEFCMGNHRGVDCQKKPAV